jgi:hypothetical protein
LLNQASPVKNIYKKNMKHLSMLIWGNSQLPQLYGILSFNQSIIPITRRHEQRPNLYQLNNV